ncbi:MAG TPA: hypothetical protein VG755_14485 [Nannocystaceae bacterium]|nr:hypothetical protein [Nannocystaceae bacterium]
MERLSARSALLLLALVELACTRSATSVAPPKPHDTSARSAIDAACRSAVFGPSVARDPALSGDRRNVAVLFRDGELALFDARTMDRERRISAGAAAFASSPAFTPDGRLVIELLDDGSIAGFDPRDGHGVFELHPAPRCQTIAVANTGLVCLGSGDDPPRWMTFDGVAVERLPAPRTSDAIAIAPSAAIVALANVPPRGRTEVRVVDRSGDGDRTLPIASLRRSDRDESDPVGVTTMIASDRGDVAIATTENRVHWSRADGTSVVLDPAEGSLAFEPDGDALWGFVDHTLARFAADGVRELQVGGPEPMWMVPGEDALGFDGDDVVVLHAQGIDRLDRRNGRWTAICRGLTAGSPTPSSP